MAQGALGGGTYVQMVGSLSRDLTVEPGATVRQTALVQNAGDEAVYVRIAFRDASFTPTGRVDPQRPGAHERSNLAWMRPPSEPVLVPGRATVALEFDVVVPQNASGSYWSSIVVQPELYAERSWTINDNTFVPIQMMTEYAGIVYTHVRGSGENQLHFGEAAVRAYGDDGPRTLTLTIRNDGDRADSFDIRVELLDAGGSLVHREQVRARVAAGHERLVTIPLGEQDEGHYTLVIVADAGQAKLFGHQYQISLP